MKSLFLVIYIILVGNIYAECMDADCGPPLGMPNYLCSDGVTVAGPGDCVETEDGSCAWEIVSCPQITLSGYLRPIEASFCMDACSYYYLEDEYGEFISNITSLNNLESLAYYNHRFVTISGEDVWCVECGAVDVHDIYIADSCEMPVDCFQDPCIEAICPAYPNAECTASFCGSCYADFYQNSELIMDCFSPANCQNYTDCNSCTDSGCFWQPDICLDECLIADLDCYGTGNGWQADCPEFELCVDLTGIDFGFCDMVLGVGFVNGECSYLSGCGWGDMDGNDWSHAFFNNIEECETACFDEELTCEEIYNEYENLHSGIYSTCEFDIDCMAVWGHCGVGLGGCHYSVNTENYPEEDIQDLVGMWNENDCMQWVCDCSGLPYAQCINNECTSAYCFGDNPAGCQQTGCPNGYDCVVNTNDCIPSYCECDGFYGEWVCTGDCGGGSCEAVSASGDLNGDGVLNVVDLVIAVDYILNGEYNGIGDMNGDGSLNVVDIIILVGQILG